MVPSEIMVPCSRGKWRNAGRPTALWHLVHL